MNAPETTLVRCRPCGSKGSIAGDPCEHCNETGRYPVWVCPTCGRYLFRAERVAYVGQTVHYQCGTGHAFTRTDDTWTIDTREEQAS